MKPGLGDTVEIIKDDFVHRCRVGDRVEIVDINKIGSQLEYKLSSGGWCMSKSNHLKLIKQGDGMDNLQKGDVLVDDDGDERTVLARLEDIVFLSDYNNPNKSSGYFTIKELKDKGYKLKSDTPQELTVEEISEKLGYEVKVVKNKK